MRGLLQGNVILGTADGGTAGLTAGSSRGRSMTSLRAVSLAMPKWIWGSCARFCWASMAPRWEPARPAAARHAVQPQDDSTQWADGMLSHFDKSLAAGTRDASCPARFRGVASRQNGVPGNPYAIGTLVTAATAAGAFGVLPPSQTCGMPAWGAARAVARDHLLERGRCWARWGSGRSR